MRYRSQIAVEPRPGGRWAVQMDGMQRAHSLHAMKADAVTRGRELAEKYQAELVIRDESRQAIASGGARKR